MEPQRENPSFNELVETHNREIVVHCYRMMGSIQEAEDIAQETMLRAWQRMDSLQSHAALRSWLYRIATNACIDALRQRNRRQLLLDQIAPLPADTLPESFAPAPEIGWLEPFANSLLPDPSPDPEAVFSQRESISLAFMIAVQYLPPRQRAVLLLRDVLNWKGREVAEFLEMTELAASSALNRARKTLQQVRASHDHLPDESRLPELLERYVHAWHTANVDQLIALIREDAIMTMPPLVAWYQGLAGIKQFLLKSIFPGDEGGRWNLKPVEFNSLPAFAMYRRQGPDDELEPFCIHVLTIQGDSISRIDNFFVPNSMMALPVTSNWFRYL